MVQIIRDPPTPFFWTRAMASYSNSIFKYGKKNPHTVLNIPVQLFRSKNGAIVNWFVLGPKLAGEMRCLVAAGSICCVVLLCNKIRQVRTLGTV